MIVYNRLWQTLKEKNISQYSLVKDYGEYGLHVKKLDNIYFFGGV